MPNIVFKPPNTENFEVLPFFSLSCGEAYLQGAPLTPHLCE